MNSIVLRGNLRKNHTAVSCSDIENALKFAEGFNDIIVHCYCGVSRSPALAYIIACSRTSPQEAVKIFDRNLHRPNPVIIRLGAEIFGNENIISAYEKVYPPGLIVKTGRIIKRWSDRLLN